MSSSTNRDRESIIIREILEIWATLNEENRQRLAEKAEELRGK